jgi:hypothetical protein
MICGALLQQAAHVMNQIAPKQHRANFVHAAKRIRRTGALC